MRTARVCAALLVCCCGCAAALGQNALGTGRGFERDLRIGGTGNTPRNDLRDELRMRNALVTGNVSGGKSLQIVRPYADTDDFRAALGSDELFRFRRDSFGVGSQDVGFRSTEAIQYQYSYTTGNARPSDTFVARSMAATRADASSPANLPADTRLNPRDLRPEGSEGAASALGTLRSPASFGANRDLSPATVGIRRTI